MSRAKIDNPASRQSAFTKRRAGLFKKANELAVLCDAELAMIIISADGKFYEFASSSVRKIITRFKTCMERGNSKALQPKPEKPEEEVPREAGVPEQKADELKSRKLLGKDLAQMSLHELYVLEEKLNKGLLFIKDTKLQLLRDELEKSRMQEKQVVNKNQMLLRQVEELKGCVARPIYYPVPISFHHPAMELNREFFPRTNFAAQLAITSGPETEGYLQDADKASLPSTSSAAPLAVDSAPPMQHNALQPAADKDSLPSTSVGAPLAILTTALSSPAGYHVRLLDSGSQGGTCLS